MKSSSVLCFAMLASLVLLSAAVTPLTQGVSIHNTALEGYTDIYSITPSYSGDFTIHMLRTTSFTRSSSETQLCYLGSGSSPSLSSCWSSSTTYPSTANSSLTVLNAYAGSTYFFGITTGVYSTESYSYDVTYCPSYGCSSSSCWNDCNLHGGCYYSSCYCDRYWSGSDCSYYYSGGGSVALPGYAIALIVVFGVLFIVIVAGVAGWVRKAMNGNGGRVIYGSTAVQYQQVVAPPPPPAYTAGMGPNVATVVMPSQAVAPYPPVYGNAPTYGSTTGGITAYGATYAPH